MSSILVISAGLSIGLDYLFILFSTNTKISGIVIIELKMISVNILFSPTT